MSSAAVFYGEEQIYEADTCEPLKVAAWRGELALHAWSRGSYPGQRLPPDDLTAIRSIGLWDAPHPQHWGLDMHYNEGIEFTYLAKGQVTFGLDGKSWTLRPGHLTITRPWQLHRVGRPHVAASRLFWLILDVHVRRPNQAWQWPDWLILSQRELADLTTLLSQHEQPVWWASDEAARCVHQLCKLLESHPVEGSETRLKLTINAFLLAVIDTLQQQRIPLDAHLTSSLRAVKMFLEKLPQHLAKSWQLDEMAAQCGLSRTQFSKYCKQITNMTPIEYLNVCRIELAQQLLHGNPDRPITDIAYACGFNSSQYFATVFRELRGCSPSEWRESTR